MTSKARPNSYSLPSAWPGHLVTFTILFYAHTACSDSGKRCFVLAVAQPPDNETFRLFSGVPFIII